MRNKRVSSSTPGNNRGKPASIRVACYQCPTTAGDTVYISVTSKTKKAICKSGHTIDCSGECKPNV